MLCCSACGTHDAQTAHSNAHPLPQRWSLSSLSCTLPPPPLSLHRRHSSPTGHLPFSHSLHRAESGSSSSGDSYQPNNQPQKPKPKRKGRPAHLVRPIREISPFRPPPPHGSPKAHIYPTMRNIKSLIFILVHSAFFQYPPNSGPPMIPPCATATATVSWVSSLIAPPARCSTISARPT
jgi:hypothetical protein